MNFNPPRPVAIAAQPSRRQLLIGAAGAWLAPAVLAQDFPNRPIRIVVPFSAGGAVDGPTRAIAQELSKRLGQQVNVENKPGAGATLGSESVAKAPADGYTLLLASQTNAISATLYPKLNFQPLDDFAPISLLGREPAVLVVNVRLNHIPYRGSAQASTDLIGGQVMVALPGVAGMLGHIRAGKLRALAVTGSQRSAQLPDVPTLAESGFPGMVAYVWLGLLAPAATPAAIIERLHRETQAALTSAEVKAYMAGASIEALGSTPAEFAAYFREERDRWAAVIKDTGAKID